LDLPVVRRVNSGDAEALRSLRLEALRLHPTDLTADPAAEAARPPEAWLDLIRRSTGEAADVLFVADAGGGRLVGMAGVYTNKSPKLAHAAVVWGVYVAGAYCGRGLGAALVRSCVEWSRDKGLVTLRLAVNAENAAARRCYQRCGFTPYGVEPAAVRWEGKLYDEVLMVMRL
jgi:RimJ/RimL family protein N-acetyltransferase